MSDGKILVVDDEAEIRAMVGDILREQGYTVYAAGNGRQAREMAGNAALSAVAKGATSKPAAAMAAVGHSPGRVAPDIVLLDIWMPDIDGISLLKQWRGNGGLPFHVVMMSGHGTIETAVEATRLGAYDFLEKPISTPKLLLTVKRALQAIDLARENEQLRRGAADETTPLGESDAMKNLRRQAATAAKQRAPVLLKGEPGSGRESYARYIHRLGRRRGPFITLGIGAGDENQQTALFGKEYAGKVYSGRLEQADGGTLYLDEVADLDADTQKKLLAALREAAFSRVDGARPVALEARVIAATRHDLEQAARAGRFREDLYYFLNVAPVLLPPLKSRAADIPMLLEHYANYYMRRDHLPQRTFSRDAVSYLQRYAWPGHLRELKNLVQRLLLLGDNATISLRDVRRVLEYALQPPAAGKDWDDGIMDMPLRAAKERFERDYLVRQWRRAGGSISRLARKIGMERTHVYRKLKHLGLDHNRLTVEP